MWRRNGSSVGLPLGGSLWGGARGRSSGGGAVHVGKVDLAGERACRKGWCLNGRG
jgi:hypothetical protein